MFRLRVDSRRFLGAPEPGAKQPRRPRLCRKKGKRAGPSPLSAEPQAMGADRPTQCRNEPRLPENFPVRTPCTCLLGLRALPITSLTASSAVWDGLRSEEARGLPNPTGPEAEGSHSKGPRTLPSASLVLQCSFSVSSCSGRARHATALQALRLSPVSHITTTFRLGLRCSSLYTACTLAKAPLPSPVTPPNTRQLMGNRARCCGDVLGLGLKA